MFNPSKNPQPLTCCALAVLLVMGAVGRPALAEVASEAAALTELPMEELMRVEITSASRRSQRLSDVPDAVHVITHEDIMRLGVRSLPEVLRLAPGVDVAQMSPSGWAVGVRGETGRFSNKLLVLIDGRSVFSPLYAGVLWEAERVPLEDIERIEIIRGPAGAIWGANAVNGVINIITREAGSVGGKSSMAVASVSSDGADRLSLRHDMTLSATSRMRIDAQVDRQGAFEDAAGRDLNNSSRAATIGVRWDQSQNDGTKLSVQGRVLSSQKNGDVPLPSFNIYGPLSTVQEVNKAVLTASLEKPLTSESEVRVQTTLQSQSIRQLGYFDYDASSLDLDVQHRWRPLNAGHDVMFGMGVTWYNDQIDSLPEVTFVPGKRSLVNTRLFVQDEYTLIADKLVLTYGARLDHDDYSGSQVSPDARLLWKIDPKSSSWVAVSRAVRAPGRLEADAGVNFNTTVGGQSVPARLIVNPNTRIVEKVNALEAGWRSQVLQNLSIDVAGFIQNYDPLLGVPLDLLSAPPLVSDVTVNGQRLITYAASKPTEATSRGVEVGVDWRINKAWRQQFAYSHMATHFSSPMLLTTMGGAPRHLASLRESFDINSALTLDFWLRYTSARRDPLLPQLDVPALTALDVNLRWLVVRDMTISAGAHNLGRRQAEQLNPRVSSPIPRSVFAKIETAF